MEPSCGTSIVGSPFFVVEFPKVLVLRIKGIPVQDPQPQNIQENYTI
jgi:hypothetical protein